MAKKYLCYYYCFVCRSRFARAMRLGWLSNPPTTTKCWNCGKKAEYVSCEETTFEG